MNRKTLLVAAFAALFVLGIAAPRPGRAVDGVIEINQAKAMAGGVTKNNDTPPVVDAPGFPVTIYQPGSYRLTGNLAVPAGANGITIHANSVTLDLNGFSITLAGEYQAQFYGVDTQGFEYNAIRNGYISMPIGIRAGPRTLVEGVRVAIPSVGSQGISADTGSVVRDCVVGAAANAGIGIVITSGIVENCTVRDCSGGITAFGQSRISGTIVTANGPGNGILLLGPTVVVNSTVSNNPTAGIVVRSAGSVIVGNSITSNGKGLFYDQFAESGAAAGTGLAHNVIVNNSGGNIVGGTPVEMGGNVK